ncbi:MAG: hypothetical protein ACRDTP_06460, partial [Mycobacteriales bacterium]
RGVLGFVRDLPQVGFVAVGALLVAAALSAVRVDADRTAGPVAGPPPVVPTPIAGCASGTADPSGGAYVGPAAADSVPAYVRGQGRLLAACAAVAPDRRALAVVSLPRPATPGDTAGALRGVTVDTAYVVVPGHESTPYRLDLTGARDGTVAVAAAIGAAYAAAQAQFEQDRMLELARADSVRVTDPGEAAGRAAFVARAGADDMAAGQLRSRCACVYGAVVSGRIRTLAALRTSSVRVIALAPAGAVAAKVVARPLLPAETTALSGAAAPVVPEAGEL